jgi:hypothetical protein
MDSVLRKEEREEKDARPFLLQKVWLFAQNRAFCSRRARTTNGKSRRKRGGS